MTADLSRPLAGNPLRTRDDVAGAARAVVAPLIDSLRASGARTDLPPIGRQSEDVVGLEAVARALWALVPLALSGGSNDAHWTRVRDGLVAGTNPDHPDYWGAPQAFDQRLVEMAPIGVGLLFAPDRLWDPLTGRQRDRLGAWLEQIDRCDLHPNNWQCFRMLVDLGRAHVGLHYDPAALTTALDGIEARACDDGWYDDATAGSKPVFDWYTAFAFHVYGLLAACGDTTSVIGTARTDRYRQRAALFARQLRAWFAPDGRALAYGRSMTYRFAQAAFWGMLAAADVEALPWGEVRGLYFRNLRSWANDPIADERGRLTVGYAYAHPAVAEPYISAGSPYWAAKAFLALLAPAGHPFWTVAEREPATTASVSVQHVPGMVLTTDRDQVLAVTHGQNGASFLGDRAARYARIAYSSHSPFCLDRLDDAHAMRELPVSDSTIALVDRRGVRRVRQDPQRLQITGELVASRWRPWPDVVVETVAWGRAPWHARAHVVTTARSLLAEEWGFAVGLPGDATPDVVIAAGAVVVQSRFGTSGLLDRSGRRAASVRSVGPGVSLRYPHAAVPRLARRLAPGRHLMTCLVLAAGPRRAFDERDPWHDPPEPPGQLVALADARGASVLEVITAAVVRGVAGTARRIARLR
jgi:hypothetical protein